MEPDISPGTDGSPLQAFSPDQLSKVKLKDIEPDKSPGTDGWPLKNSHKSDCISLKWVISSEQLSEVSPFIYSYLRTVKNSKTSKMHWIVNVFCYCI